MPQVIFQHQVLLLVLQLRVVLQVAEQTIRLLPVILRAAGMAGQMVVAIALVIAVHAHQKAAIQSTLEIIQGLPLL
ncbi:MAG: hypothetical protein CML02_22130 [Pseudooceanicola sp.]|nr:hypothetical protein [Pseudooceanicola sp.]